MVLADVAPVDQNPHTVPATHRGTPPIGQQVWSAPQASQGQPVHEGDVKYGTHMPACVQTSVGPHTVSHAPQCAGSPFIRLVSTQLWAPHSV